MSSELPARGQTAFHGFRAVPIHPLEGAPPLRLCVLARRESDPVSGHFVLLRTTPQGRVYLGCIADAGGVVHEWLELWVQVGGQLEGTISAVRDLHSNETLDRRWREETAAFEKLRARLVHTGWEEANPRPILLDLERGEAVAPGGRNSAEQWELCKDDAALKAAGLPLYHRSLSRYLWQPGSAEVGRFVPVSPKAEENERTIRGGEAFPEEAGLVDFNGGCGLMRVAPFAPFGLGEYVDLLGGEPWKGTELGKTQAVFDSNYAGLEDWESMVQGEGFLFLGQQGKKAAAVEALYLKLQLFTEMVRTARTYTCHQQLPFLNLTAESFRVRLARVGKHLPLLWTARVVLAQTGAAWPAPVQSTEARYFIRGGSGGEQIFLPAGISRRIEGAGSLRFRQVLAEKGGTVVEGTLAMEERGPVSPHDLFWIRVPLASGAVTLYGHLYRSDSLAAGEARFRTLPQAFAPGEVERLKAAEGAAFPKSPFEILPLLSSPCDLYSLGVLGVRALLVNAGNSLPIALDELLSLGREAGALKESGRPLQERVGEVMEADPRFQKALGVHRILRGGQPESAETAAIPLEFWHEVLACLIRFFPGGADGYRKDCGDAPPLALDTVYQAPVEELEGLLRRGRSLIVIDWRANREIHGVIGDLRSKLGVA